MTTKPDPLGELIERVEKATGPDREIDRDLWWRFDERASEGCYWNGALGMPRKLDHDKPIPAGLGCAAVKVMAPNFTGFVDAALALIERVLPEASCQASKYVDRTAHASVWTSTDRVRSADGSTPALALCLALLRLLQSQQETT